MVPTFPNSIQQAQHYQTIDSKPNTAKQHRQSAHYQTIDINSHTTKQHTVSPTLPNNRGNLYITKQPAFRVLRLFTQAIHICHLL